ncbi:hypothetical protein ACN27F_14195 [Solwaraspora sp. WMMB335]|uniref:hypothetical protein n=1 Tax=Solwaraspora sp. WMMB335 TaxID=3404118 RepID=UPI003B955B6F
MSYNSAVDKTSPRRLRSTSVQLGTLTALALTLSGCNLVTDDDCDDDWSMRSGTSAGGGTAAVALAVPAVAAGTGGEAALAAPAAVPDRGGFGTHLASCGG